MEKLNKQYFETRNTHKKSVKKHAWIIWVIVLVIVLIWILGEILHQLNKPITEKTFTNQIENFGLAKNDTIVESKNKGFQILVKKGLYFGYVIKGLPLMIVSKDSTDLNIYVKATETDKDYKSLIKHWASQINKTDYKYKFSDITDLSSTKERKESGIVELVKNGRKYIGQIVIIQNGIDIYIIQGLVLESEWDIKKPEIEEMINSFRIMKNGIQQRL